MPFKIETQEDELLFREYTSHRDAVRAVMGQGVYPNLVNRRAVHRATATTSARYDANHGSNRDGAAGCVWYSATSGTGETTVSDEPTLTPAQAAAATLEADRRERAQRASEAIAEILKREDCDLRAAVFVTPDGRLDAQITIVAK